MMFFTFISHIIFILEEAMFENIDIDNLSQVELIKLIFEIEELVALIHSKIDKKYKLIH